MPPKPPAGFVAVGSLSSHLKRDVNIMGVVTDFQPPARSRGTDWMCSFRLADLTHYDDGTKFRCFRPMEADLPVIEGNGDVVILERVKITYYSGMIMGMSSHGTTWVVFPSTTIPESVPTDALDIKYTRVGTMSSRPTQEQMRYAIELCNSRPREPYRSPTTTTVASATARHPSNSGSSIPREATIGRRDKFALIKDVRLDTWHDLVGQVIKIYPGNGVTELYVTDYTTHPLLYHYEWTGDEVGNGLLYGPMSGTKRKWPGPFGKHTLTVNLFPPHSYYAQSNVKENDFVFLRNTRLKHSRDLKMEGTLHTDRQYPDRVDIRLIEDHDDVRVKGVLRRKLEYNKSFRRHHASSDKFSDTEVHDRSENPAETTRGQKRKSTGDSKLSKNQRRKRRKREREDARLSKGDAAESESEPGAGNTDPFQVRITAAAHTPPSAPQPPKDTNKHIRSSNPDVPLRSLSSILSLDTHAFTTPNGTPFTLPFQNIKSRAIVRVVDFFPDRLVDFAVRKKKSEFDVLSDYSQGSSDDSPRWSEDSDDGRNKLPADTDDEREDKDEWEWRFGFVLEDACSTGPERLSVHVSGADAVFLTKLDACDLRRRPQALLALTEKLFLIWGELEEKKSAGLGTAKGLPFECCIKEYGVRSAGATGTGSGEWERRFAMFGTTTM
ncbi:MAG: hypothetical protein LQ348_000738 [Seirophora lacunosa]|nr:MAG: hypothetical protein LQ348_000738 [Seirophora lacunosa]